MKRFLIAILLLNAGFSAAANIAIDVGHTLVKLGCISAGELSDPSVFARHAQAIASGLEKRASDKSV